MPKYINVLSQDSDAKDIINLNAKHSKQCFVSQEINLSGVTTITFTALTDDLGNSIKLNDQDVVTHAAILHTVAITDSTVVSGTFTLGVAADTTGAFRSILSGIGTSVTLGTKYALLYNEPHDSLCTTLPYVCTADNTSIQFGYVATASATTGKVRVYLEYIAKG